MEMGLELASEPEILRIFFEDIEDYLRLGESEHQTSNKRQCMKEPHCEAENID